MQIQPYCRTVHYYETDQMGVVHHANYIRWFEEARVNYLEQMGTGYAKMESLGIVSPVLSVSCEYRHAVRFGEAVVIFAQVTAYTGTRMQFSYEIRSEDGERIHAEGSSSHCFLDAKSGRPTSIRRHCPDIHDQVLVFLASLPDAADTTAPAAAGDCSLSDEADTGVDRSLSDEAPRQESQDI